MYICLCPELWRPASMASLASLSARFRCRAHILLRECIYACVRRWGAPQASLRSPCSAPAFIAEFICVLLVVSMLCVKGGATREPRLAHLDWWPLFLRVHVRIRGCNFACVGRWGASRASPRSAPALIVEFMLFLFCFQSLHC